LESVNELYFGLLSIFLLIIVLHTSSKKQFVSLLSVSSIIFISNFIIVPKTSDRDPTVILDGTGVIKPTSPLEVAEEIDRLKVEKSPGPDRITVEVLETSSRKELCTSLSLSIRHSG
jgi:hypothetical protein